MDIVSNCYFECECHSEYEINRSIILAISIIGYVISRYHNNNFLIIYLDSSKEKVEVNYDKNSSFKDIENCLIDSFVNKTIRGNRGNILIQVTKNVKYIIKYTYIGTSITYQIIHKDTLPKRIDINVIIKISIFLEKQISNNPNVKWSELNLLDKKHYESIINESYGGRNPYSKSKTIAQLFEEESYVSSAKTAYIFSDKEITYKELRQLVYGLSNLLLDSGCKKGNYVLVILENSFELPITLLSLMLVGCPFVIVDSNWPTSRINRAIHKISPKSIIYTPFINIHKENNIKYISLRFDDIPKSNTIYNIPKVNIKDIIYGLFTSGSTGEPKCALNIHLGILNRFKHMDLFFGEEIGKRILQTSKQIYDGFLWQLFWPLTHGGLVVIPEPSSFPDVNKFIYLIENHSITMTDIVPSVLKLLLRVLENDPKQAVRLNSLQRILIGGEKINSRDIEKIRNYCPNIRFTNTYGPTEASIGMIMHNVTENEIENIPLGHPITNTYTVIVDNNRKLLPIGMIGELLIGGDCLGIGYYNEYKETQKKFIDNCFPSLPIKKLYHTGDLGYLQSDNNFQYVGRIDHQVNIGGLRVELLDIESAIKKISLVEDVAVITNRRENCDSQLVAFIVTNNKKSSYLLDKHIITELKKELPSSFIPQRYMFLNSLPLMQSGKKDRQFLLKLLSVKKKQKHINESLLNNEEQKLYHIWANILKIKNISLDDDFFDLGGSSLDILTLIIDIQHKFNYEFEFSELYKFKTIKHQLKIIKLVGIENNETSKEKISIESLYEDIYIDINFNNKNLTKNNKINRVLLTGITGFVGAHIAKMLFYDKQISIVCPVRASNTSLAIKKVKAALAKYDLWKNDYKYRLEVILCDLSEPFFGLSENNFKTLISGVDTIVLNAASVNFLKNYELLKKTNVNSIKDVLNQSLLSSTPVHYISSLSVYSQTENEILCENTIPELFFNTSGYIQTKWVADRICLKMQHSGANISIYRLGEMMPSLTSGKINDKALITHLLVTSLKLGVYPSKTVNIDYSPVDIATNFIVESILSSTGGKTYNIYNPITISFSKLILLINSTKSTSGKLQKVSDQEFIDKIHKYSKCNKINESINYISAMSPEIVPECGILEHLLTNNINRYKCNNLELLIGIENQYLWPDINSKKLENVSNHILELF